MGLKSAKEKLLSFAVSLNPDVKGVGQTPPTVQLPEPEGTLLLQATSTVSNNSGTSNIQNPFLKNLKIEQNRIIPYATAHIFNHDMSSIMDLLSARKLESQLDEILLKKLYENAAAGEKAQLIVDGLSSVDLEAEEALTLLSALESLFFSIEMSDAAFEKQTQQTNVTNKFSNLLEALSLDPITTNNDEEPQNFLDTMSEITSLSISQLESYTLTALFIQALADAEQALRYGTSVSFFVEANARKIIPTSSGFSRPLHAIADITGAPTPKNLSSIGIGDNNKYDGIFSNNAMKRLPDASYFTPIKTVSYYCSLLSREFLISAGLGRVVGTPLGQTFGATSDPMLRVFGARNIKSLYNEQSEPNSLSDFALVDSNGNIQRKPKTKRVLVLEGERLSNSGPYTSKTEWIDTIKTDPLNNKLGIFDGVMTEAIDRFEQAQEFLTTVLGRDTDRSLLSPRGLFGRILKDFAKLLEGLTVETNSELCGKNAVELMLLVSAAKGAIGHSSSLKRRMHIFAARLATLRRNPPQPADDGAPAEKTDDTTPLLRITSKDASKSFQSGLMSLNTDIDDVAEALGLFYEQHSAIYKLWSPPPGGKSVTRTGQQIVDSVADNVDAEGLNDIIVSIFEDLQEEALALSQIDDGDKTYLREGNSTRYSGFDGAITLAFIIECFITLADAFVDTELRMTHGTNGDAQMSKFAVLQGWGSPSVWKKALTASFLNQDQEIWFIGGPTSKINKARKFLLELASAIENDDTSNLIDADDNVISVNNLTNTTNIGVGTSVTPSLLIDTVEDISKEDDIPMKLFAISRAIMENMRESTTDVSLRAQALRGDVVNVPEDISVLQSFNQSSLGANFINGLTKSQLRFAHKRLDKFNQTSEAPYNLSVVSNVIFDAIKFLLEEKKGEFIHSTVMFLGLPTKLISSELLQKGLNETEASLRFSIDKIDEIIAGMDYEPIEKVFALKYSFDETALVDVFELENPPTNFNELILSLSYKILGEDEPIIGSEIIGQSGSPTQTRQHLQNIVESYLLKKMFEILEGMALMGEKIQFNSLETRGMASKDLLAVLTNTMNLDQDFLKFFFEKTKSGLRLPDKIRINQMIQPQKIVVDGIDAWKNPVLSPSQIDTLYKLFSTKPFYSEKVKDVILTTSVFDDVFAVMVDLDSFELTPNIKNIYVPYFKKMNILLTPDNLYKHIMNSKSPDRLNIESLYVSAELESS